MEYRRNDIDISQFLPPVSRDSRDIQEIMRVENPEFILLWEIMADLLDNQFIPTMGELGLSHWEWILEVLPQDTDTIEDRRNRILRLLAGTDLIRWRNFKKCLMPHLVVALLVLI